MKLDRFEADDRLQSAVHEAIEAGLTEQEVRDAVEQALASAWEPE